MDRIYFFTSAWASLASQSCYCCSRVRLSVSMTCKAPTSVKTKQKNLSWKFTSYKPAGSNSRTKLRKQSGPIYFPETRLCTVMPHQFLYHLSTSLHRCLVLLGGLILKTNKQTTTKNASVIASVMKMIKAQQQPNTKNKNKQKQKKKKERKKNTPLF